MTMSHNCTQSCLREDFLGKVTEVLRRHPEDGPRRAGLLELQATLTVAPCFCEEKLREQLAGYGMQLTFLETADVADFLEQAQVLATFEGPGSGRTYVMRFDGRDLIAVMDSVTGSCAVIDSTDGLDDGGGSIHQQVLEVFGPLPGDD